MPDLTPEQTTAVESIAYAELAVDRVLAIRALVIERDSALARVRELEEESRWISVEERFPEPMTSCVVFVRQPIGENLFNGDERIRFALFEGGKFEDFYRVLITHWRPLPAPPTETTA